RHTRCYRDWSSDVCSSDLLLTSDDEIKGKKETAQPDRSAGDIDNFLFYPVAFPMTTGAGTISVLLTLSAHENEKDLLDHVLNLEIGRASCRERVIIGGDEG